MSSQSKKVGKRDLRIGDSPALKSKGITKSRKNKGDKAFETILKSIFTTEWRSPLNDLVTKRRTLIKESLQRDLIEASSLGLSYTEDLEIDHPGPDPLQQLRGLLSHLERLQSDILLLSALETADFDSNGLDVARSPVSSPEGHQFEETYQE